MESRTVHEKLVKDNESNNFKMNGNDFVRIDTIDKKTNKKESYVDFNREDDNNIANIINIPQDINSDGKYFKF